jgi:hypothetical protein
MQTPSLSNLAGEIRRFDLATGAVQWQRSVGSDVNVSPSSRRGCDRDPWTAAVPPPPSIKVPENLV